jgi:hypothetical protein
LLEPDIDFHLRYLLSLQRAGSPSLILPGKSLSLLPYY